MFAVEMDAPVACQPGDVGLKFTDQASDHFKQTVTDYFKTFAKPSGAQGNGFMLGHRCIKCGEHLTGMLGTFRWDFLCYGEFRCGKCSWPGRGCHSIKDSAGEELLSIGGLPLQYMPEFVDYKPAKTDEKIVDEHLEA